MLRLYSKTTGSTYMKGVHTEIPGDAIEITEELYMSVIGNPQPGKVRSHDDSGLPCLVDPPAISRDSTVVEREWRDTELASIMWLRERHRDQLEIAVDTTLTGEQFTELLLYMQGLRDWPQSPDFPDSERRPLAPAWIADQTE